MDFVRTNPEKTRGRSLVPVAPDHSGTDYTGTLWTAAPRSRVVYAIRFDDNDLRFHIRLLLADQTFPTLTSALQWVADR
jgi:hypothetical protein